MIKKTFLLTAAVLCIAAALYLFYSFDKIQSASRLNDRFFQTTAAPCKHFALKPPYYPRKPRKKILQKYVIFYSLPINSSANLKESKIHKI